ncbi:hypothetical protein J4P90_11260 [Bacillus sp. SY8(2021)]|uniref:Uncharacterized protein n=1 Tax=Bacillus arachidis TaxID=2819290 RepID=A0ABS3NXZ8_9BACI|nr:hypothetical protein [Bacillus arachidis]
MKKWLLPFILCFSMIFAFFPQSKAEAAGDKSTITFNGTANKTVKTTRKIWVPKGGYLGVYGQNTDWGLDITNLKFRVYRADGNDVTNQFWHTKGEVIRGYYLSPGEIVNKQVGPIKSGNYYYIRSECEIVLAYGGRASCDGSFTISSRY